MKRFVGAAVLVLISVATVAVRAAENPTSNVPGEVPSKVSPERQKDMHNPCHGGIFHGEMAIRMPRWWVWSCVCLASSREDVRELEFKL